MAEAYTRVASFILIRPTVWPQYTNVTDRQDRQAEQDRQRFDSIGPKNPFTSGYLVRHLLLGTDSDGDAVTSDGRLFQTRASGTPKARSPTVTRRVGGMFSSNVEVERSRRREFMSTTRRSSRVRYGGDIPRKQREASTASLNSIHFGTRNQ